MPKDRFYFDHDYSARNDDKILQLRLHYGAQGYGVFWMVIETMAENENGGVKASLIGGLSLGYGVAIEWLQDFIKSCISIELFYEENGYIFSKRLLTHKEFRKSLVDFGTEGAKKRWGGYRGANGGGNGPPNANKRKGKENKRGVRFSADGLKVFFDDDTSQDLDLDELRLLEEGTLQPHYVKKK